MDSLSGRRDIAIDLDKPDWLIFKATITFIKKDKKGGA
jgi:hypothetical protein